MHQNLLLLLRIADRALTLADRLIINETDPAAQRKLTEQLRTSEEALAAAVAQAETPPNPTAKGP